MAVYLQTIKYTLSWKSMINGNLLSNRIWIKEDVFMLFVGLGSIILWSRVGKRRTINTWHRVNNIIHWQRKWQSCPTLTFADTITLHAVLTTRYLYFVVKQMMITLIQLKSLINKKGCNGKWLKIFRLNSPQLGENQE